MSAFESFDEISEYVQEHQDVLTLEMLTLREVHGAARLGKYVRENISKELRKRGLYHFPPDLPSGQDDKVRVYRIGTPVGELIQAVLTPGEDNDDAIRKAVNSEYQAIVDRIKELVEGL